MQTLHRKAWVGTEPMAFLLQGDSVGHGTTEHASKHKLNLKMSLTPILRYHVPFKAAALAVVY